MVTQDQDLRMRPRQIHKICLFVFFIIDKQEVKYFQFNGKLPKIQGSETGSVIGNKKKRKKKEYMLTAKDCFSQKKFLCF